jgi:hypothetical protein
MTDFRRDDAERLQREVYELADAQLRRTIAAEGARRLGELVRNNPEARRHYVRFMHDSAKLCQWSSAWEKEKNHGECGTMKDELPAGAASAAVAPSLHHSSFIVHHLPLFAYAIAALLMATALVAARLWGPAGGPQPSARHAAMSAVQITADSMPVIVGRITGMKDCRWANPGIAAREMEAVPRGGRYVLNGGLLEITYNTGAKIIIEGPAVYAADGGNWGTLSLGRLTARVGKRDRPGVENGEATRNRGARPPWPAAFGVQTPTSTLLDNGDQEAEFGVEVDEAGTSYAHIFRGLVVLNVPHCRTYTLGEGYCGWTRAGPKHDGAFIFKAGQEPWSFALEIPKPKPTPVCSTKQTTREGPEAKQRPGLN